MTFKCLLISPYRSEEKHPANPLAVRQRFLNFGALSLASFLTNSSFPTLVLDEYTLPAGKSVVDELDSRLGIQRPLAVGVSAISSYSADRARLLLRNLADRWPEVPKVIGGQHFVGFWGARFPAWMPEADILIAGESEVAMKDVLANLQQRPGLQSLRAENLPANVFWKTPQGVQNGKRPAVTNLSLDELVGVDYDLYPGSEGLFPSIEYSRGCPYSCVFCANGRDNRRGYRRASAASVARAVCQLVQARTQRPLMFYMQASNFAATKDEAKELALSFARNATNVQWRTEVRVDSVEEGALQFLAEAGLKVLDVGLESASHETLINMRKCPDPDLYLRNADRLLHEAYDCGIFTKVNYLIHPGDTLKTVQESWDWLMDRSGVINGISSGVTLEYPGTPLSAELSRFELQFGTKRLQHPLSNWGVYNLQPSAALGHGEAESLAIAIAQSLQTRVDFARSKSFGYLGTESSPEMLLATIPEASHATPYRK